MEHDKPSSPPRSMRPHSTRLPQSQPPPSRRSTWPVAGPKRKARGRSRKRTTTNAAPTVRRSFVVELVPSIETQTEILARITPTEQPSAAAIEQGFRFGDALLDTVSDFLIELAREQEHKK